MQIDLSKLYPLQFLMSFMLVIQTTVSFTVFGFLQPISYLSLGLTILGFLFMSGLWMRRHEMTRFGLLVLIYYFLFLMFTFVHGTDIKNGIYRTMEGLFMLMLFSYYRDNLKYILFGAAIAFSLCIYFNLGLMILFPDWMFAAEDTGDAFILGGNYNQMGGRMLAGIVVNLLCVRYTRKWIINVVGLFLASIIELALVGSMTSLSCVILFAVFCLVPFKVFQRVGIIGFFIFYLFFHFFVVFQGEGLHNNETAVYIIEDVLGKDITFTNRTTLWAAALEKFGESPIIGYGNVDADWYLTQMSSFAIGPHNFICSVLITGGITLMLLFIVIFLASAGKIYAVNTRASNQILFGLLAFLFILTMEVYPLWFVFLLLAICYYYPDIQSQTEKKNEPVEQ